MDIYHEILISFLRPQRDPVNPERLDRESEEIFLKVKAAIEKLELPPGWKLEVEG